MIRIFTIPNITKTKQFIDFSRHGQRGIHKATRRKSRTRIVKIVGEEEEMEDGEGESGGGRIEALAAGGDGCGRDEDGEELEEGEKEE